MEPKKSSVCCRDMDEQLWTYFDMVWNGFIPLGITPFALFI